MKINFRKTPKIKLKYSEHQMILAAAYPSMYCPRCNSNEIGLRQLSNGEAIWECRDCFADFRLLFPPNKRF